MSMSRALPLARPAVGASPDPADGDDWRTQAQRAVTTLEGLEQALRLTETERRGVERALAGGFALSVTPYYLGLADPDDPACPIRRQCVPLAEEATIAHGDLRDPLGEEAHEVAPNLVRRYPDRVLQDTGHQVVHAERAVDEAEQGRPSFRDCGCRFAGAVDGQVGQEAGLDVVLRLLFERDAARRRRAALVSRALHGRARGGLRIHRGEPGRP